MTFGFETFVHFYFYLCPIALGFGIYLIGKILFDRLKP